MCCSHGSKITAKGSMGVSTRRWTSRSRGGGGGSSEGSPAQLTQKKSPSWPSQGRVKSPATAEKVVPRAAMLAHASVGAARTGYGPCDVSPLPAGMGLEMCSVFFAVDLHSSPNTMVNICSRVDLKTWHAPRYETLDRGEVQSTKPQSEHWCDSTCGDICYN